MTELTSLLAPVPSKFLLGYMVLNASKNPELPFMPFDTEVRQHIEGSSVGSVACIATESHPFFYPQRRRIYTLNSVQNYGDEADVQHLMSDFANIHDKNELDVSLHSGLSTHLYPQVKDNSLMMIEQFKPFGLVSLISKGVDLYMYGLHTEDVSLLVWTNMASFEDMLTQEYGDKFWLYRFRNRRDLTTVIFTRRVCKRWFRWSQESNFKSAASRFPALEKSLFKYPQHAEENV